MDDFPLLILIASIIGLSILTTNWYFNSVMAVSIGNTGGASVIQEQVNTAIPSWTKKLTNSTCLYFEDPSRSPSKQIVDNCYSQNSISGITGPGNHNHNNNNNNNNIIETPSTKIATPPPGVLVEVP